MRGTDANVAVSRSLAVAALMVSAAMLLFWCRPGSVGTAPLPVGQVSVAAQVQGERQPSTELEPERSFSGADIQKREKLELIGPMRQGVLMGRVFDPDGNPVAGAIVALLVLGPMGPYENLHASVHSDLEGWFVLVPPVLMRGRDLALIARRPGYRPFCIPFQIEVGTGQRDLELRLERGFAIAGRIVSHGEGVSGATINIDLRPKVAGIEGIGEQASWIDGRLEKKKFVIKSDADGRFRVMGLGPHQHHLYILPGDSRSVLTHEISVSAPSTDLEIDVTPAELEVTVRRLGETISGAWIVAQFAGQSIEQKSDASRPTILKVVADEEVRLSIHDDWSEVYTTTVKSPALGSMLSVPIDLVAVERPSLRIHLKGARAQRIRVIEARLVSTDKGIDTARLLELGPKSDHFTWQAVPLPPGPYRLVIGPAAASFRGHLLSQTKDILLPKAGRIDAEFALQYGGKLMLSLDLTACDSSRIEVSLLDASGAKAGSQSWHRVGSRWQLRSPVGIMFSPRAQVYSGMIPSTPLRYPGTGGVPSAHRSRGEENLAPGNYRLKIEVDGKPVIDREVELFAEATTSEFVQIAR